MKSHIFALLFLLTVNFELIAQVQQEWVRIFDGQLNYWDDPTGVVCDAGGNIYVGGTSAGNGGDRSSIYEYVTFKYSPSGQFLWLRRYNGDTDQVDQINDVNIDAFSNVIVTGASYLSSQNTYDWTTIKYNQNGDQQWLRTLGNQVDSWEQPRVMKLDANSNIYIAGYLVMPVTRSDICVVKYNSGGQLLWQKTYDEANGTREDAVTWQSITSEIYIYWALQKVQSGGNRI
jgi:hypothetical protein